MFTHYQRVTLTQLSEKQQPVRNFMMPFLHKNDQVFMN